MLNVNRVAKSNIDRSWFRASRRSLENVHGLYIQTLRHTISRENELVIVRAREVNTDIIFVVSRCRARRKKGKEKNKEQEVVSTLRWREWFGRNARKERSASVKRDSTLLFPSCIPGEKQKGGLSTARYGRSTFSSFSLPANRGKTNRGKIKKLK